MSVLPTNGNSVADENETWLSSELANTPKLEPTTRLGWLTTDHKNTAEPPKPNDALPSSNSEFPEPIVDGPGITAVVEAGGGRPETGMSQSDPTYPLLQTHKPSPERLHAHAPCTQFGHGVQVGPKKLKAH